MSAYGGPAGPQTLFESEAVREVPCMVSYVPDITQKREEPDCFQQPDIRNRRASHAPILCAKCVRTALYGVLLEGIGHQGRYGKRQLEGTLRHVLGRDGTAKMASNRTLNQRVV